MSQIYFSCIKCFACYKNMNDQCQCRNKIKRCIELLIVFIKFLLKINVCSVVIRHWCANDLDELLVLDGAVDVDVGLSKNLFDCNQKRNFIFSYKFGWFGPHFLLKLVQQMKRIMGSCSVIDSKWFLGSFSLFGFETNSSISVNNHSKLFLISLPLAWTKHFR